MLAWPLLLVYFGLAAAFLVRLIAPSAYVFATVSNLTYGMAGLACTPALQTPARRKAGATPRGALPLLILGAASAAHHARPRSGLAAHHLDIVFGWFLVLHLAHTSVAVAARFLVALCGGRAGGTLDRVMDAAMYVLLATVAVLMFSHYETLHSDQIAVYLSLGLTCAAMTGLARLLLAHDEEDGFTVVSLTMAAMETAVIALALVAAVFVQGELLGRDIANDGMRNETYNLYHGNWHFLIASVAVIVYVRLADAEALVDSIVCGNPRRARDAVERRRRARARSARRLRVLGLVLEGGASECRPGTRARGRLLAGTPAAGRCAPCMGTRWRWAP